MRPTHEKSNHEDLTSNSKRFSGSLERRSSTAGPGGGAVPLSFIGSSDWSSSFFDFVAFFVAGFFRGILESLGSMSNQNFNVWWSVSDSVLLHVVWGERCNCGATTPATRRRTKSVHSCVAPSSPGFPHIFRVTYRPSSCALVDEVRQMGSRGSMLRTFEEQ